MTAFDVPGAMLDVELSDQGGPPVVQLHGLTSSRARDRVLHLDLGRGLNGTRLLRYDARGHGRSTGRPLADDYRWSNLADDLLLLLDAHFPNEQVHGVGPSMGTATLLHAAVKDPGRFSGLTLMVPPTAWETRIAKSAEYRRIATIIEDDGVDAFVDAGRDAPHPPAAAPHHTAPDVAESILPSLFRGAGLSDLPTPQEIVEIDVPTTILAWIDDPAHPVSTAVSLVTLLHNSSLRVARTPEDVARWPSILRDDVGCRE